MKGKANRDRMFVQKVHQTERQQRRKGMGGRKERTK